jgi:hypothetical protein
MYMEWLIACVLVGGGLVSVLLAARLRRPGANGESPILTVVDGRRLRRRLARVEFQTRQLSELLLGLRVAVADLAADVTRDNGDVRRSITLLQNNLERVRQSLESVARLDAEVELLGTQRDLGISALSMRLDRLERRLASREASTSASDFQSI